MNVGEMQRTLSLKAEREPGHCFSDLYGLLCHTDWLWLAYEYVAQNAGSKTAGCDGINVWEFYQDEGNNLRRLQESLKSGKFEACPARRVYKPNPYTTQEVHLEREELLEESPWLGIEERSGMEDLCGF